jgi:hypothetical protein
MLTTCEAAFSGNVDLLRWLCDNGCPWDADLLCLDTAESGSVEILKHLQRMGLLTSTAKLTDMLNDAGQHNKLAAAKWLREQCAEWPTVFRKWYHCSDEVLAWARNEGCTSPIIE